MKLLEKIARKYIERKDKEVKETSAEMVKRREILQKERTHIEKLIRDEINLQLLEVEKKMKPRTDIKEGDMVVLNKYAIKYDSANSWDSGAPYLSVSKKPVMALIEKIFISDSRSQDYIDRFLDRTTNDELRLFLTLNTIFHKFNEFIEYTQETPNDSGLYYSAKYKIDGSKDTHSSTLNLKSFLALHTTEADKTIELWNQKSYLEESYEKLSKLNAEWMRNLNKYSLNKMYN